MPTPSKKTIYFVGPEPPPSGGVAAMNMSVQRLIKEDYAISSFNTASGSTREDLYGKKGINEIAAMIKLLFAYTKFLSSGKKSTINIFVTSGLSFIRDIFFIIIAKVLGYRIIIHLHAKAGNELFAEGKLLRVFSFFTGLADAIMTLSSKHKEYFSRYIDSGKFHLLENFVFTRDFEPIPERRVLEFLYVGRLTEQKGFYDLLDALTQITSRDGLLVHVIGVAESAEREEFINALIEKKGLSEAVTLHGVVQGTPKHDLFRRCAVLIFPSHMENSPVVLKEALMARQAVIYSDIQENMDIMSCRKMAYPFKCGDSHDLMSQIVKIFEQKDHILSSIAGLDRPLEYSDLLAKAQLDNAFKTLTD